MNGGFGFLKFKEVTFSGYELFFGLDGGRQL
jgi:hypothetical protein